MTMEGKDFIAIDLGTSYCRVAVWKDNHVQVIEDAGGKRKMASYVTFSYSQLFIGDVAESKAHRNVNNTVSGIKRLMGRKYTDTSVQEDIRLWPFKVIQGKDEKPVIVVNEKDQLCAEEICAILITKIKEKAESYLGAKVKNAVITVPACFNSCQVEATKCAGKVAGLNVSILKEPVAVALSYALDEKKEKKNMKKNILIFNLGGGILDVTVMIMEGNASKIGGASGDSHLGGEDFDNQLVNHFVKELESNHGIDIKSDHKALRKLRACCEKAKISLSFCPDYRFEVETLYGGNDYTIEINQQKFEQLNSELFKKCIHVVKECLKDAKMKVTSIDEVVLVGGSTRIPKLRTLLKDLFHDKKLFESINTEEAVVSGAAIQASLLSDKRDCSSSFGISATIRIHAKVTFPITNYKTHENKKAESSYTIELPEKLWPTHTGIPCRVPVFIVIDEKGVLSLSTKDSSGIRITTEKEKLTEVEIEMAKNVEKHLVADANHKKMMNDRNALEELIFQFNKEVNASMLMPEEKEEYLKKAADLKSTSDDNPQAAINEIENIRKKISKDLVRKAAEQRDNQSICLPPQSNMQQGDTPSYRDGLPSDSQYNISFASSGGNEDVSYTTPQRDPNSQPDVPPSQAHTDHSNSQSVDQNNNQSSEHGDTDSNMEID